jgi:predicted RNase H-like nuclease
MIVLGMDSAWTTTEPSGVALVVGDPGHWSCAGLAPSYRPFGELAAGQRVDWMRRASPGAIDVGELLSAAETLAGGKPDVIAVDMPLAFTTITSRRASDTAISTQFGAAGAAVHSPNAERPGAIADRLRIALEQRNYPLVVTRTVPPRHPALIETYPHPITMWLCDTRRRVPYKARNSGKYWPGLPLAERRRKLLAVWQDIIDAVGQHIDGISLPSIDYLSTVSSGALKAFEDGLDALICAIAGISYLAGNAIPYGDAESAIWLPVECAVFAARPDRYSPVWPVVKEEGNGIGMDKI